MAKQLSYANALKRLGGQDRPLLDLAEKLTNEGMDAAGVPGLFGLREFVVGHGRRGLENLGDKLRGTSRLSRMQRIEAAHKLLLVVSFFEPLDACLSEAGVRLRSEDLELTADEQEGLLERALRAESVYAPAEDFVWDRENLFDRAEAVFTADSEMLLQLVRGLAATERTGIDAGHGGRLATALGKDLPRRALAAYRDHYLELCTEAPEFGMWAQLREHEKTRRQIQQVGDAFAGLHERLSRIGSGRAVGELRGQLSRKYQALLNKPVLPVEDVLPEDLPAGMVIPSLGDCYVPPSARVARVSRGDAPSAREWWQEHELLPDLQRFLAARLTHPDMTRYPTVLLGEPGAGKSKLTEVLAAQLPEEDFLAVRVELRSVSADAAVHTQIEEGLEHDLLTGVRWTELLAEAGGALPVIILDGFDELLQAAGVERYNYLEQIRDFQAHQEDMGQPVAVIVTSRTLSASRVRFPERSTVIRLEPFGEEQIERVRRVWNHANRELFRSPGLQPLDLSRLMAYPELSRQPLLLLLLLVYDAQDNDLQQAPDSLSLGELYERLLTTFVRRQVRKHRDALAERDLRREVQGELRRLEATALAMFTRQRQSVGSAELGEDLRALKLDDPRPQAETSTSLPIKAAELLLGRFFFVHVSRANASGPDEAPLSAYEFLHATFGEYLTARMVHRALRALVNERVRHEEEDSWGEPPNDGLLYATSSFACYSDRERIVDFLRERIGKDIGGDEGRRAHYCALLVELFRQAPYPSPDRLHSAYQPRRLPLTSRQALYTANLLVLFLIARGEPVDIRELFADPDGEPPALHRWRSVAALWRALPSADWFTVLDTLRLRHLRSGESCLELEDRSPVNVGESIRFELPDPTHTSAHGPVPADDAYPRTVAYNRSIGQMLRSTALRINGTAARTTLDLLPYLDLYTDSLGAWNGYSNTDETWSLAHELLLLRLSPATAESSHRRLHAYRRVLGYAIDASGLLALKQADEDLRNPRTDDAYRSNLRHLLDEHLNVVAIDGRISSHRGETEEVLDQLSAHLSPGLADQVRGELRGPGDASAPDGSVVTDTFTGSENSVVDLRPFVDEAHQDPWSTIRENPSNPSEPF
ncbi:hypothetical protein GCM10007079_31460 [Nocardiopsis terrae]|uniref:AAA+ ATPase domain-containing protein n=1 Tax=Nocardiopsis terrae TaxID=372655 RepID=A0ABR9HIX9_9ACTN|nr:ATP-binding protein [Nocardiopsis terrae]MBE1458969.1 hypothetical protein [Nocardiopsis terrae]GHC87365.1 hypothetical protein GCM10007079_31460 [Nocardiopsis terrae]